MQEKHDVPIKVFLSSASQDSELVEELKKTLKGLKQKIHVWAESDLKPGDERRRVIAQNLHTAHLILLLISKNFINSNECYNIMLWAMNRQKTSGTRVIPIILDAGDYVDEPFHSLETLPRSDMPPVTGWKDSNDAFLCVAKGIREVVEELLKSENSNPSNIPSVLFSGPPSEPLSVPFFTLPSAPFTRQSPEPSSEPLSVPFTTLSSAPFTRQSPEPSSEPLSPPFSRTSSTPFTRQSPEPSSEPLSPPFSRTSSAPFTRQSPEPLSVPSSAFAWTQLIPPNAKKGCSLQTKWISIVVVLGLITVLATIVLAHIYPQPVIVKITPNNKDLNANYSITAVTSTPDTTHYQVQARQLSYTTPPQSKTVNATGIVQENGLQANGTLTFYNGMTIPQVVAAGTVFTDDHGVQIVNAVAATIPAADPPTEGQITVNAHAANTGLNGNIVASDINVECCTSNHTIFVRNLSPFAGGKDALSYTFVQQSDIDGAAGSLEQSLTPSAQSSLQSQVHSNEKTIAKPECTKKFTSNKNVNDHIDTLEVTVSLTCKIEVYDEKALYALVTSLLKQEGTQNLGTSYAIVDKTIEITAAQVTVIDAKVGTVSLQVRAGGLWVYQFDAIQKQRLIKLIVGKTQQDAIKVLKQQAGVLDVQIDGGVGNLPMDSTNIIVQILIPTKS